MEITGIIHKVYNTRQVSDKFKLREFVIKTDETYPQSILLQLTQDKCSLLDKYKEGSSVKAHINIRGKEYKTKEGEIKFFNSIEAWRIEDSNGSTSTESNSVIADDGNLPF